MRAPLFAVALLVLALAVAGCGDDDGAATSSAAGPPATTATGAATTTAEGATVASDSQTPGGGLEVPAAQVDAQFEEWFAPIAARADAPWQLTVTPPLPLAWPPAPGARWVRWAYAQGFNPELADAVRVARIWANAELRQGSQTAQMHMSVPQLSAWPNPQGVRPLSGDEAADLAKLDDAAALALTLTGEPDAATAGLLRSTYGAWVDTNGVVVASLPDAHDAFLAWLAEEPVR
jgi:hypothetical protein